MLVERSLTWLRCASTDSKRTGKVRGILKKWRFRFGFLRKCSESHMESIPQKCEETRFYRTERIGRGCGMTQGSEAFPGAFFRKSYTGKDYDNVENDDAGRAARDNCLSSIAFQSIRLSEGTPRATRAPRRASSHHTSMPGMGMLLSSVHFRPFYWLGDIAAFQEVIRGWLKSIRMESQF